MLCGLHHVAVFAEFRDDRSHILVATDLASRGLGEHSSSWSVSNGTHYLDTDVSSINFVINYDFPNNTEDYVHRIGRTARGENTGTSYTFFTSESEKQADELVKVLKDAKQEINPQLLQFVRRPQSVEGQVKFLSYVCVPCFLSICRKGIFQLALRHTVAWLSFTWLVSNQKLPQILVQQFIQNCHNILSGDLFAKLLCTNRSYSISVRHVKVY